MARAEMKKASRQTGFLMGLQFVVLNAVQARSILNDYTLSSN